MKLSYNLVRTQRMGGGEAAGAVDLYVGGVQQDSFMRGCQPKDFYIGG